MIFFYKCISTQNIENIIVYLITVFAVNFKVLKMKVNRIEKLRSYGYVFN